MSDICAKNLGHGHAFNRPFGSTYKCQWCGELQSDIAEVESLLSQCRKEVLLEAISVCKRVAESEIADEAKWAIQDEILGKVEDELRRMAEGGKS